jgi:hypothetical protein
MIQSIHVYWDSIAKIPKGILKKIWKKGFHFLWSESHKKDGVPLVRWSLLAKPKIMGEWGIKNTYLLSQALARKSLWRLT